MLIFNCTQAACDFLTGTVNGKQLFNIQNDLGALGLNAMTDANIDHWQLHCAKLGRKHVLVAMQVDTRFAMVFVGVKRRELGVFFEQFRDRYVNELLRLAHKTRLTLPSNDVLANLLDQRLSSALDIRMYKRGNRSVQTHINQVLEQLYYEAFDGKGLPAQELHMVEFDERVNSQIRKIGAGDYFDPALALLQREYQNIGVKDSLEEVGQLYRQTQL